MDSGDKRIAFGVGGAVAVCCMVHLLILAGGIGALGGVAGGLLTNPYLIAAGLTLLGVTAVLALRRTARGAVQDEGHRDRGTGGCCPPPSPAADRVSAANTIEENSHR